MWCLYHKDLKLIFLFIRSQNSNRLKSYRFTCIVLFSQLLIFIEDILSIFLCQRKGGKEGNSASWKFKSFDKFQGCQNKASELVVSITYCKDNSTKTSTNITTYLSFLLEETVRLSPSERRPEHGSQGDQCWSIGERSWLPCASWKWLLLTKHKNKGTHQKLNFDIPNTNKTVSLCPLIVNDWESYLRWAGEHSSRLLPSLLPQTPSRPGRGW